MLSTSQKQAVCHGQGPCLTLAGPGSGKTTVLISRILHLLSVGVAPEHILVITFTKAAAKEMKERFFFQGGEGAPVVFGTFHSVFYGMLRQDSYYKKFRLMDHGAKRMLLRETMLTCGILSPTDEMIEALEQEIGFLTNTMSEAGDVLADSTFGKDIGRLYENYQARKTSYHLLDYDDLLLKTYECMQKDADFRTRWQERFRYLLIDEVQDMNPLQFAVIRLLALPQNNLFVVGDDDQSIYAFRGANPEILLTFPSAYPTCKQIILENNYRCGKMIVEKAQQVIRHNEHRFSKNLVAANEIEGEIFINSYASTEQEAEALAQSILEEKKSGVDFTEIGVLFRNHKQGLVLARALAKFKIPFAMREKLQNPYAHFVMQDMISYLRISTGTLHRRDLFRIMNRPNRYLTRESVEKEWITFSTWKNYYASQDFMVERIEALERDVSFMRKLSGTGAITYIRRKIGYDAYLKERASSQEEWEEWNQIADMLQLLAKECRHGNDIIVRWEEQKAWVDHVNEKQQTQETNGVRLSTLHAAKGLEFASVYLVGCNEGVLPSQKAHTKEQIEEERRLFYVGMTRAKSKLSLSYVEGEEGQKKIPSRFLQEMQGESLKH